MSPQYTHWYPRRLKHIPPTLSGNSQESLSSYSKAVKFLKSQFFSFDTPAFSKFMKLYTEKHGEAQKTDLEEKFSDWKYGKTRMPEQTVKQILTCVPPCLSKEKQYELLCFQIPSLLYQQKIVMKVHHFKTSDFLKTYQLLAHKISHQNFTTEWFLDDLLSGDERNEFLDVFRYIMLDNLQHSFQQVQQDVALIHDMLPAFEGSIDSSYRITLLDCTLDIDTWQLPGDTQLPVIIAEPDLVSKYRDRYQEILIQHTLSQRRADLAGQIEQHAAITDIQAIFRQLKGIRTRQEYNTRLVIKGYGGTIKLTLQKKNLSDLKVLIAMQVATLFFIFGTFGVTVVWAAETLELAPMILMTIWGFITLYMTLLITKKIRILKSEMSTYQQKYPKKMP